MRHTLMACLLFLITAISSLAADAGASKTDTPPAKKSVILEAENICSMLAERPTAAGLITQLKAAIRKTKDAEDKQRYLVIYALACKRSGRRKEAAATTKYFKQRHPRSRYGRYLTLDEVGDVCAKCSGGGKSAKTCASCEGSTTCAFCKGAGSKTVEGVNESRTVVCPRCYLGKGKCHTCKGAGSVTKLCGSCMGSGKVISTSKMEAVISKLCLEKEGDIQAPRNSKQAEARSDADEASADDPFSAYRDGSVGDAP